MAAEKPKASKENEAVLKVIAAHVTKRNEAIKVVETENAYLYSEFDFEPKYPKKVGTTAKAEASILEDHPKAEAALVKGIEDSKFKMLTMGGCYEAISKEVGYVKEAILKKIVYALGQDGKGVVTITKHGDAKNKLAHAVTLATPATE